MERSMIIKALKICSDDRYTTHLTYEGQSIKILLGEALSLIKELTEENDRLSTALAEYEHKTNIRISEEYVHNEAYEELREENERLKLEVSLRNLLIADAPVRFEEMKADTVKKMQESIKNRLTETYGDLPHTNCFINAVDRIAKEMLEGDDE